MVTGTSLARRERYPETMRWAKLLPIVLAVVSAFGQQLTTRSFGGSGSETATGIAADHSGNLYIAGSTTSFDLPLVNAFQSANPGTPLAYSPDAGVTWQPVPGFHPEQLPFYAGILTAADPTNEDVFYVATGAKLYKTTDRGAHFTAVAFDFSPAQITAVVVDPANPKTVYASARGMFKSIDGGTTWASAGKGLPDPVYIDSAILDPFQKDTLWVWVGSGGYVTRDGAATWTLAVSLDGASITGGIRFEFDGSMPGVIYGPGLSGSQWRVQRSMDGGQTWTALKTPFSGVNVAAGTVRAGSLYALGDRLFFRSDDFGASWRSFPFPASTAARIAVDPADPNVILAGQYRSVDRDQTWAMTSASRELSLTFTPRGTVLGSGPATADGFLVKYRNGEDRPAFATYFGGSGNETVRVVKTDPAGNVWIAGSTTSADLPVTQGAMQRALNGPSDAFVAEFSADGALLYCTYIGGSGDDGIRALAIDPYGELWVTGTTTTRDFPITAGALPPALPGPLAPYVFAAKLGAAATKTVFASYIGTFFEYPGSIATDAAGNAIVTGTTYSPDFPVTEGAYKAATPPGMNNKPRPFVVKYSPAGSVIFSTYLDAAYAVAVAADGEGSVYIAGNTTMTDFPVTPDAVQKNLGAGCGYPAFLIYTGMIGTLYQYLYDDVFLTRLSGDGKSAAYSTLLGGACYDRPTALAVADDGLVWIAGETDSDRFPLKWPLEAAPPRGEYRTFLSAIDPASGTLRFSTYLSAGAAPAIELVTDGTVHMAGAAGYMAQTSSLSGSPFGPRTPNTDALLTSIRPAATAALNLTGVANAFSLLPGPVAPGEIVALSVPDLVPATPSGGLRETPAQSLSGIRVMFDGRAADLVSVLPGSVVAIVPPDLKAGASTRIQAISDAGASNAISVPVVRSNAGMLPVDGSGTGDALAWNSDGSVNGPDNPAVKGSTVVVLVTGVDLKSDTVYATYGAGAIAPMPGFVPGVFAAWLKIPAESYVPAKPSISVNSGGGPGMGQFLTIYVR